MALLPFRRKACWRFFHPEKSWRLQPGLNPRTWVLKGSTLPLDQSRLHVSWVPHKNSDKKKFYPSLEGPKKGTAPPCSPKWGPYGNRCPFPEPYLAYPLGSPVKEPSPRNAEKTCSHHPRSPHGWKTHIQWGATWFPKGIVNSTALTTPVPFGPQHDTFHLGLGRP